MANSVEILVHIAAPSTTKEDDNYRAHADAYFEFEPVSRVRIFPDSPSSETGTDELVDVPCHVRRTTPQDEGDCHRAAELDGQSQKESHYIPNYLSSGKSTPLPSTWGPSFGETTCGLLDLTEISVQRSFSQNDADAVAEHSFLTTINSPRIPGPGPPILQIAVPSSQVTETPPSEVPESQSSFQASWDVEKDNSPPRRSVQAIQIGRSPLETHNSQSKRRRISASPACIPSSIPAEAAVTSSVSELPAISQPQPQPQRYRLSDNPAAATPSVPLERLSFLPLEINPPRPIPSSTAQFTTHITPTLQMLADKLKLSKVFNPLRQTRPLRTLERGYWLLDITISDFIASRNDNDTNSRTVPLGHRSNTRLASNLWTSKCFFDFWDFLSKFIAHDGRAGWGVWCICESKRPSSCSICSSHSHSVIDLTSQENIQSSAETQAFHQEDGLTQHVTVKIYTWGEIAPHIYLLMYLASDRNVRKVPGVQWRDGADHSVIFMG